MDTTDQLERIRKTMWRVIGQRVGRRAMRIMREDFEDHLALDGEVLGSEHAVEVAYSCLITKLVAIGDELAGERVWVQ